MKKIFTFLLGVLCIATSYAQNGAPLQKNEARLSSSNVITVDDQEILQTTSFQKLFEKYVAIAKNSTFELDSKTTNRNGLTYSRYQQYIDGIKVEGGQIIIQSETNKPLALFSSAISRVSPQTRMTTTLSRESGFAKAISFVGANKYMWEFPDAARELDNYKKPQGELVFYETQNTEAKTNGKISQVLAYKYDVFAFQPMSRGIVYVDANTGNVIGYDAIIKHYETVGHNGKISTFIGPETEDSYCNSIAMIENAVPANADTRYSGSRTIETMLVSTPSPHYILQDVSRDNLATRDAFNQAPGSTYPYISNYNDFEDVDNNWTAAEYDNAAKDNAALDAHWGAMMTYDYLQTELGRDSFDDAGAQIRSYVHVDTNYDNAFWNGSVMSYGDGSSNGNEGNGFFDALTSLDVAAHEIGHAVTQYTSNLAYQRESGALNEGFSDIWAAAVEYYAKGTGPNTNPNTEVWLIGDEIDRRSGSLALRSMSNPNIGSQPDTYGGTHWYNPNCGIPTNANDYCGVHINSGVLNFWFYLSVVGGSGTNDIGNAYNVTAIGMDDAAQIAYDTLLLLTANATFADARDASIQSSTALFGACSAQTQAITNAWHAVGVGTTFSCPAPSIAFEVSAKDTQEDTNCSYTDIDTAVTISRAAADNGVVTFTVGAGTATEGEDFDLMTPTVTFPTGSTANQVMTVRVYHDALIDPSETILIDFTVGANTDGIIADPSANSLTITILDDDENIIPTVSEVVYEEDFEGSPYLVSSNNSGDGNPAWYLGTAASASSSYWTIESTNSTAIAYTNDDVCNCDKSNDLLTTTSFSLDGYSSANVVFDHAFSNVSGESAEILISTGGSFTTLQTLTNTSVNNGGGSYTTPWVNGVTVNLTAYVGQPNVQLQFKYNDGGGWAYGMAVDNIVVSGVRDTEVQTAVNEGVTDDLLDIPGNGTVYSRDAVSNNVMLSANNLSSQDYGCTSVSVSRAGNSAQSIGGSAHPNLVTDKRFTLNPAQESGGSGSIDLTFYFTEAEILGWETATGLSRNDLMALRINTTTLDYEIVALTLGNLGSNVSLTGTFTDLANDFYFGVSATVVAAANATCLSTTTWDGTAWDNGTPDATTNTIINGTYDMNVQPDIEACALEITGLGSLIITSGKYIRVQGDIVVNGMLDVKHEGSVVQVDDIASVVKTGTILIEKITDDLGNHGFSILSSPMSSETRESVYSGNGLVMHHVTSNFSHFPGMPVSLIDNWADDNGDNWQNHSGVLVPGEGYLVNPPFGGGPNTHVYTQGVLNNGEITFNAQFNTAQNDSPNIIGNPYASAIDINLFLNHPSNSIVNELSFWEHITDPSAGYPGYQPENYSMGDVSKHNGVIGIAPANDLLRIPSGIIASGQAFGLKPTGSGTLYFYNSMRVTGPNDNYRSQEAPVDKLWVQITNETYNLGSMMAVAFLDDATNEYEAKYDSKRFGTPVSLYSIVNSKELGIQGRAAFNEDHIIPLGFSTQVEEYQTYSIKVSQVEGALIEGHDIYLKDFELGTVVNLSEQDSYEFSSSQGNMNSRFVLFFKSNQVLTQPEFNQQLISLYPNPVSQTLHIETPATSIQKVILYDTQGRVVLQSDYNEGGFNEKVSISVAALKGAVYFVQIETNNGKFTKQLIKK